MNTTPVSMAAAATLRDRLTGHVVLPGDGAYDSVRRLWNGAIDRRPALVVRCATTADVLHALRFARDDDRAVAVRGGGHSIPGWSSCDGGVMIDLQPMRRVVVDPVARTAVAQPGLTWAPFDAATQQHGLATPGGEISHTGIAGLTLGGGIGWLRRVHGLTCDNLLAVEMVTASGEVVRAGAEEEPDLLWALRGGGGNFGIVTEFTYRLHPVGVGLGGFVMHPLERGRETLEFLREMAATAEDRTALGAALVTAPPAPFVPEAHRGRPVVMLAAWHAGTVEEGERALAPLRRFGPPVLDGLHPIEYVALQSMLDETCPHGLSYHIRSEMLTGLTDGVVDAALTAAATVTSPLSQVLLHRLGGAMGRVPHDATAFPHRGAAYMATVNAAWDPRDSGGERHERWARATWEGMRAAASTGGSYVNHLGVEGDQRVRAAYGERTFERLRRVKTDWDPDNVFRLNQNIPPLGTPGVTGGDRAA